MKSFNFLASAFKEYPVDVFFGMLWTGKGEGISLTYQSPIQEDWGFTSVSSLPLNDEFSIPKILDIVYLSILEKKFYSIECVLPYNQIDSQFKIVDNYNNRIFDNIIIGMTPFGGVAVWLSGEKKELLIGWLRGEEIEVSMQEFCPHEQFLTLEKYCSSCVNNNLLVKTHFEKNGLPRFELFDNYMKQFTYRYLILIGKRVDDDKELRWKFFPDVNILPNLDYFAVTLFDGSFDKLNDGNLMEYHSGGKPKKCVIKYIINKKEYSAYFWFEEKGIEAVFNRFYGTHPETKTDFIIRIDAENKKYELALYRQGLKEPVVIPESAYQLIVFKNKFEDYRSENYNQPRGAWIW